MTDCIRIAFDKIRRELSHCIARERKLAASLARAEESIVFLKAKLLEKEKRETELEGELAKFKKHYPSSNRTEKRTSLQSAGTDECCTINKSSLSKGDSCI